MTAWTTITKGADGFALVVAVILALVCFSVVLFIVWIVATVALMFLVGPVPAAIIAVPVSLFLLLVLYRSL